MELFDFDGFSAVTFGSGDPVALSTTIQDGTLAGDVSFTLSFQANFSGAPFMPSVRIVDRTDPGFEIVPLGFTQAMNQITQTLPFPPFFEVIGTVTTTRLNFVLTTASIRFELNPTAGRTAFDTAVTPVLGVNGGSVAGTVDPDGSGVRFSFSTMANPVFNISQLSAGFTCFCAGTQISTRHGSQPVETLRPGDLVRLADGRDVPVRWIGRQRVDTRISRPAEINPIRITRGALGEGLPERDLRLSQDHAIALNGYLINAGALVNGTTIYQETNAPRTGFTYYHIETDTHELILAEGVAAETFVDYRNRETFDNADEISEQEIREMDLPRISAARLLPEQVRRHLTPLLAAE